MLCDGFSPSCPSGKSVGREKLKQSWSWADRHEKRTGDTVVVGMMIGAGMTVPRGLFDCLGRKTRMPYPTTNERVILVTMRLMNTIRSPAWWLMITFQPELHVSETCFSLLPGHAIACMI